MGVAPGEPRHYGHEESRAREVDVVPKLQEAQNRVLLLRRREPQERARELAARSGNGHSAGPVEPAGSRGQARPTASKVHSDEQFFDQQAVVEKNDCRSGHALLIREFWIMKARQALVVPFGKYAA